MDSPRVLVSFGRWPKCGWMLSVVVKIMPLGAKQTEVAAVFERTELPSDRYYECNAFLSLLKFSGNRRAVICDREFVGA